MTEILTRRSWLDDIEDAAERGGRCVAIVNPLDCYCEICAYRLAEKI